jgi:ubiquinone/menaquinone biosynthesis C-methylase UbiE
MSQGGKIEIPSVDLLDRQRDVVNKLWDVSRATRVEPGWHYLLDLAWIAENLGPVEGKQILDAGAGMGLMQWYLVEQGAAEVISADRGSRYDLPLVMRSRYKVYGLRQSDLGSAWNVLKGNVSRASGFGKVVYFLRGLAALAMIALPKRFPGRVLIYNQDLTSMPDIPDNSLDAVVAVSALEHNTPEGLQKVVAEIMRKLKPGGQLLATLCAGRDKDWFHEPSRGWCYTDTTLRRLFELPEGTSSNYTHYDELFNSLKECAELRDNLAKIYFRSGDNGMPWGRWDPQYQPVGVRKIKPPLQNQP